MISLRNKTVIITGASSGIGAAAALRFADQGANLVLSARRKERLEKLKARVEERGVSCIIVPGDVKNEKDVKRLFRKAIARFKDVDILVNNAGRGLKAKVKDISMKEWLSVMNTNLTGVFLCTREVIRHWLGASERGHIITISSIAGLYGTANYAAYCASKHGVTGFKRSVKWEMRQHGIKASTIHPGRIDTEFFDSYKRRPGRNQMLSADDLAAYIVAVAKQCFFLRIGRKLLNLAKRAYYFIRYFR